MFNDLHITDATSIEECMDSCATSQPSDGESLCYAIAFDFTEDRCVHKKSGFTTANLTFSNTTHAAIAHASQLTPLNTACPYGDSSTQPTSNGMQFEIKCGKDFFAHDMISANLTDFKFHTNNLKDCMEIYSNKPLCLGVGWNPDLLNGFASCYPKNSNDSSNLLTSTHVTNTALAQLVYNASCNDNSDYITENSKSFHISCGQDQPSYDIISSHQPNLESCIESCSTFKNSSLPYCEAIAYASNDTRGYENCYLKSAGNGTKRPDNATSIALLTSNSTNSGSTIANNGTAYGNSDGDQTSPSRSNAWTAGPVIGAVVGFALLAGLLFWLNRRRTRPGGNQAASGEGWLQEKHGTVVYRPVETQLFEAGPGEPTSELEARSHGHELDGRSRF